MCFSKSSLENINKALHTQDSIKNKHHLSTTSERNNGSEAASQPHGQGPDLRSDYNHCATLVNEQKFDEAEPLLRKLLNDLEGRSEGRETRDFMLQEAGTLSLLGETLEGLGKGAEAATMKERGMRLKEREQ